MSHMKKLILPLLAMLMVPGIAGAAERADTYIGVGYHWGDYKNENSVKSDPSAVQLVVGHYLLPIVAIEGRFGKGVGSDGIEQGGSDTGASLEVDRYASVFARIDLPLADWVNLYGLGGYTEGRLEASAGGYSVTDKDSGLSYGVGLEMQGRKDTFISAEYIQYLDESDAGVDYEYNGFNVNVGMYF